MALIDKRDFNYKLNLGDEAQDFSLPGVDGKTYSLSNFTKDTVVVFFTCNHCPYVHGSDTALIQLVDDFKSQVDFVGINSNESENYPEDSFENMQARAEEQGYNFVYLRDKTQNTAKAYGGECTPHFFVFQMGKLVYQGRLNDAGMHAGSEKTHELQDALEELVAGRDVSVPLTNATGCSIKWA